MILKSREYLPIALITKNFSGDKACAMAQAQRVGRTVRHKSLADIAAIGKGTWVMRTDNLKVLLISDMDAYASSIEEQLSSAKGHHFKLEVARTLSTAIERLATSPVAVILLDLVLPDSVGLATFLRLYAKADGVPVVVLTVEDDEDSGVQALKKGALEYLVFGNFNGNLLVRSRQDQRADRKDYRLLYQFEARLIEGGPEKCVD